ncbi:MAG: ATP-binding protein [Planctomycetaceae bacterium]|nr:ATP-binding protein [Planctomycetaceae bacterium]
MTTRASGILKDHWTIPSDVKAARDIGRSIMDAVARLGYSERLSFAIRLALEEGLVNAIHHGNRHDPDKHVEVEFVGNRKQIQITITDQGQGFDPAGVPDPTADENLEKPTGRGIMLMHAYMDEVHYASRGRQVVMKKLNRD